MKKYRHELKYEVSVFQIIEIKNLLKDLMFFDNNVSNISNTYIVRSLYFDDYGDSCFYDNEDGINCRSKFRIRTYNYSTNRMSLELKQKNNNLTSKEISIISKETSDDLINGCMNSISNDKLLNKFYIETETKLLSPKVIVEYDRIPFIYHDGNVRVTFDTNIRASTDINRFYEEDIYGRNIMNSGKHLMEVKYDEFLPDFIYKIIQTNNLKQVTFSKYYLSRRLGGIN